MPPRSMVTVPFNPSDFIKAADSALVCFAAVSIRLISARIERSLSVSDYEIHHAPCPVLVVKEAPRSVRQVVPAIDGSPDSDKAVRFLLRHLAPQTQWTAKLPVNITVVHAMPGVSYPEMREASQNILQRVTDMVAKAGFQVHAVLRPGKPAEEILQAAKRTKAALIITGATGLGAIGRLVLGSVSTRVVQHSSCSVLVVR